MKSLALLIFSLFSFSGFAAGEFFGDVAVEGRGFNEKGTMGQDQFQTSLALDPQYTYEWNGGRDVLTAHVFGRFDSIDDERTHFDVRQLDWVKATENFELRLGVRKVFWGVTESAHIVDVINQTDFVENFDGEQKLGQPMANLAWVTDLGTFDFFVLPFFRERTFAGEDGRLGFPLPVGEAQYENDAEEGHIDSAFRWSHSIGAVDIGLSYFNGTSRDPRFLVDSSRGEIFPFYDLIHQVGLDFQWTTDSLLLKAELLHRDWNPDDYFAAVYGLEYTFSNVGGVDIGVLAEHHYDDRDELALTPFENDLFLGSRLAFNDVDDTQVLAGIIFDLEKTSKFLSFEASRRIGNSFQVELESRTFLDIDPEDTFVRNFETESYSRANLIYSY